MRYWGPVRLVTLLCMMPSLGLSHQTPAPLFSAASAPGSVPVYATVSSPTFLLSSLQQQLWLFPPLLRRSEAAPVYAAVSPMPRLQHISFLPPRLAPSSCLCRRLESSSSPLFTAVSTPAPSSAAVSAPSLQLAERLRPRRVELSIARVRDVVAEVLLLRRPVGSSSQRSSSSELVVVARRRSSSS